VQISSIRLAAGVLALSALLGACSSGASTATVSAASVGTQGTLIVASNGMTVYQFSKDVANSGTSACTDKCLATWPAVTVPAGSTPTAGAGAAGTLGTISRPDTNGALQVTYNGLPIYYFSGDSAVGDTNGIYTNWAAVKP
jgi:predicted lipoprotein with Yx(FWY)xxD motif